MNFECYDNVRYSSDGNHDTSLIIKRLCHLAMEMVKVLGSDDMQLVGLYSDD